MVRSASPAKEEEDEEECEKDVEHDDEREEGVGYEWQTSVSVSWRNREVGILPQPGQGEVLKEGVREYDVHLCVVLLRTASSYKCSLPFSPSPLTLHPPRQNRHSGPL